MTYCLAILALALAVGVAGPPLWYTHTLPLAPAVIAGTCIAFAFYLLDPAQFKAFVVEARTVLACWLTKGAPK